MINIQSFTFNPFQENTYILYDETNKAVIIDPGCYEQNEQEELRKFIEDKNLKVTELVNTHCHVDHVLGNAFVKRVFSVPFRIHLKELSTLKSVESYGPAYGFHAYESLEPDAFFKEGEKILFGNSSLDILFLPGHSVGHVAFYSPDFDFCIGGDVLFYRSIGRYDLPGGDYNVLMNSIKTKLFTLPDSTIIYPGHGPVTTIGDEKKLNPFMQ